MDLMQGVLKQVETALQEAGEQGITESELVEKLYPNDLSLGRMFKTNSYLLQHTNNVRYVLWIMIHDGKFQPAEGRRFVLKS